MASNQVFANCISRLRECFGEKAYAKERCALIWTEVKNLQDRDLISVVDDLIADSRFAPTRKDFRQVISERRFATYQQEKKEHLHAPRVTFENAVDGLRVVGKILEGAFTTEQIKSFAQSMHSKQVACRSCDGSGYIHAYNKNFKSSAFVFKCICPAGKDRDENFPVWGSQFSQSYSVEEN